MNLASFLGESGVTERGAAVPLGDFLQHLSASSVGMLMRCPRQFQERYIHGRKERPGESIVIGSFMHETLQWNYEQKIESHTDQPVLDALAYLHDVAVPKVIEEEGGEDNIKWDEGSGLDSAQREGDRITSAYYRTVVPRIQPISTESRFEIEVPGVEVPVIGYTDIQDEWRNIDTKSGKNAVKKVKPSWMLQGRIYAYATGKPVEFHSISRAKTPTIITGLESDAMTVPVPSPEQMKNTEMVIATAADLLRYFLATYGTDETWPTWGATPDFTRNMLPCDFCGYRKDCPAWAGASA